MIHLVRRLESRNFNRPNLPGSTPRRWPLRLLLGTGLAYLAYLFVFSDQGLLHILALKRELGSVQRGGDAVASRVKRAEEELVRVRTDPFYTEKYVRENTGMVRPGEIVYRVVPESVAQEAMTAQRIREQSAAVKPAPAAASPIVPAAPAATGPAARR